MVVFSTQPVYDHGTRDEYWKIRPSDVYSGDKLKSDMKERGFKGLSSARKKRLLQATSRMNRGLLSYDGCLPRELKSFCVQRRLLLAAELMNLRKRELVNVLERADDEARFPRFLDLPPELREWIYKLYFRSLPKLEEPTQPPISTISRLIRIESLPNFYKECEFVFSTYVWYNPQYTQEPTRGKFFDDTRPDYLKMIRKLSVDKYKPPGEEEKVKWKSKEITFCDHWDKRINNPGKVSKELAQYLEEMPEEEGWSGLSRKNIVDLRNLMRKSLIYEQPS